MIANHANQVILDNLVKQNGAFDVSTAYQAMKEQVSTLQSLYTAHVSSTELWAQSFLFKVFKQNLVERVAIF